MQESGSVVIVRCRTPKAERDGRDLMRARGGYRVPCRVAWYQEEAEAQGLPKVNLPPHKACDIFI